MTDYRTPYNGITVRCSEEQLYYPGLVNRALETIASKRLGYSLLRSIVKRSDKQWFGYTVLILKPENILASNWTNKAVRVHEGNACNRTGTGTVIHWNPNIISTPDGDRPPFIGLAHELIHAMQNLRGTALRNSREEEYATVGLEPYQLKRKRNENAIRHEHGIAARAQYSGL